MLFCQTVKKKSKIGAMGLSDFFSILAFTLMLIVFYLIMKFTIGKIPFVLQIETKNVQDSLSVINILRTPVKVDNTEVSIAQLIALSQLDSTKKDSLEKMLVQIMDDSFSTSNCAFICINEMIVKGSGCQTFVGNIGCSKGITIPSYDERLINVYLESKAESLNLQAAP